MTPALIAAWAALLVVQNASFTIVSRARNSSSDWYHAIASVFSNGIWFLSQTFLFVGLMEIVRTASWGQWGVLLAVYVVSTVIGSVSAGRIARNYLEKGNRRVGHYEETKLEKRVRLAQGYRS